ncbi:MAG TPA: ABC transporter substrate-binding protein [Micromonosporaceae bacterium]|jgi:alpha-glucoside transport system substrate-binding protein|nr:ABC transporter substrate-binding protein [Micromonosporaceae bacterium]
MIERTRRRALALAVPAVAALVVLASCGNKSGDKAGPVPTLTGDCAKYQAFAGHAGKTVSMFASIISPESDSLQKSWSEFSQCTGIKINYEGSNDFESQLQVRVSGGTAPDFAIIPQPGLLQQMVKTGKVVKPPAMTVTNVDKYWNKAWKAYGTVNGTFYAAPMSANMKSLVWYSPKAFTAANYKVPTTWADMMSLSDTIAATGKKPWCGGIGSGTATGWPATDWIEQIVLRTGGGDVYDKWVSHDIKFSSPEIKKAMETLQGWMLNPKYVNGGFGDVKSIATTTFQDAGKPILNGSCFMLQQASFYGAQWPKGTKIAEDGDVFAFYLPGIESSVSTPVVGGGEFATAFANRPEVQAVQNYLTTPEWHTSRIKAATGWVSANQGADQTAYTDPIDKLSAKYLTDPNATFRFDASDLMPAAVGSGQEWKSMTAWFAEGKSIEQVTKDIDAAWPS